MTTTEELQTLVLTTLDSKGSIENTKEFKASDGKEVDQLVLLGALKSLVDKEMVEYDTIEDEIWVLTDEGDEIVDKGSHEANVFEAIPAGDEGLSIPELQKLLGNAAKIGQGKAFKNKWITKKGDNLILTKGPKFSLTIEKQARDITFEMLQSGEWKKANFKKYNFDALGIPPSGGHLHPLMKIREELRQIFFEMGFEEMPTNRFVESSFWNFDALFQPQQHPARDAHDTFFIKDPAVGTQFPTDYLERVKKVHSVGGYGSTGYGYDWKIEEAQKLLLRTHTTAVSSFMLYNLAQKEFKPVKYFSIDRVFRNETVDATHLAEFHQVEGVIADKGLTLGDLIGFMETFYEKMGIKNLRFKPAYNPYTEPSMEIFSYHEGLGKWVEIGNSGMFRPEMLEPMGLDPEIRVIAWGLGLERPAMIKYGLENIREVKLPS
ncbi:3275_t:CDS:2 [Rhizophagus irregularis]|nr:3275_t:CDS:2 [Rhizophagus irregularis]